MSDGTGSAILGRRTLRSGGELFQQGQLRGLRFEEARQLNLAHFVQLFMQLQDFEFRLEVHFIVVIGRGAIFRGLPQIAQPTDSGIFSMSPLH